MRTAVSSGLLAYLQEGDTFVILELINSSLHFLARSPRSADYVEIYPTANVSDGKWHAVTLKTSIHVCTSLLTPLLLLLLFTCCSGRIRVSDG